MDDIFYPVYARKKGKCFNDGWLGGGAPGLALRDWPTAVFWYSQRRNIFPMIHALTCRLPQDFPKLKAEHVGVSLFHYELPGGDIFPIGCLEDDTCDRTKFIWGEDEITGGTLFAILWHTQETIESPICLPQYSEQPRRALQFTEQANSPYIRAVFDQKNQSFTTSLRNKNYHGCAFAFGGIPDHLWQAEEDDFDLSNRPYISFNGNLIDHMGQHLLFLDNGYHYWDCD